MKLSDVAHELYGLPVKEFTGTRDARASEARKAGDRDLADSVKRLRKPSTGAWIVNRLVREKPRDIERLINLGTTLRSTKGLEGTRIRHATREKGETIANLLRQARSVAKRADLPLSPTIETEIEGTLDAAFSDRDSALSLREGCLTTGLRYSGLGFGADPKGRAATASSRKTVRSTDRPVSAEVAKAKHTLDQARSEAKVADSNVEKAGKAVKRAESDLRRLQAALTVTMREAARAHEKASKAQTKLDLMRRKPTRSS
jgi:hypothetical protein